MIEYNTFEPSDNQMTDAVQYLIDNMPADLRTQCETLAALDDSAAGIRLYQCGDAAWDVVWVGIKIGRLQMSPPSDIITEGTDS